jgi:PAS domain S-box-containing protein
MFKDTENELIQNEQKCKILFEKNPQPMWIYDLSTLRFLEVNDAAVLQYGYSRDEFLSMTIKDIRLAEE